MSGPTQPRVIGEDWSDERIKSFLDLAPPDGDNITVDADYYVLEKAYRSMIAEDFCRFVQFFLESGRNLSATNRNGITITE